MSRNKLKEVYEDHNEMLTDRVATLLSQTGSHPRAYWERQAADAVNALTHLAEEMQVCTELECSGILGMPGVSRSLEARAYREKFDGTINNAAVHAARFYRKEMLIPAVQHKMRVTELTAAGIGCSFHGDPRGAVLRLTNPFLDSLGWAGNDGAPVWPPSRSSDYNYETAFRRMVYWTLTRLEVQFTKSVTWDRNFIAACEAVNANCGE